MPTLLMDWKLFLDVVPWFSLQSSSLLTLHRVSLGSWSSGWGHICLQRISSGLAGPDLGRGLHPPS